MSFPECRAALRKERGFTQQQMADKIVMYVSQFKHYEAVTKLDERERDAVETVIASVLHMHNAKRWTQPPSPKPARARA